MPGNIIRLQEISDDTFADFVPFHELETKKTRRGLKSGRFFRLFFRF